MIGWVRNQYPFSQQQTSMARTRISVWLMSDFLCDYAVTQFLFDFDDAFDLSARSERGTTCWVDLRYAYMIWYIWRMETDCRTLKGLNENHIDRSRITTCYISENRMLWGARATGQQISGNEQQTTKPMKMSNYICWTTSWAMQCNEWTNKEKCMKRIASRNWSRSFVLYLFLSQMIM